MTFHQLISSCETALRIREFPLHFIEILTHIRHALQCQRSKQKHASVLELCVEIFFNVHYLLCTRRDKKDAIPASIKKVHDSCRPRHSLQRPIEDILNNCLRRIIQQALKTVSIKFTLINKKKRDVFVPRSF